MKRQAVTEPAYSTLVEFLEGQAGQFEDRPALLWKPTFRYRTWSYRDLWEGAGRVATLLQRRGLLKGDQAVLWGPNSPYWVLAFFGCLRAGVVAVPIDLRSSPDFVERVVSRTRPRLSFVSRLTPAGHEDLGLPEVYLEQIDDATQELPPPEAVPLAAEDLVEIMFTSGTTGDPKGVMLSHRNLIANMEAVTQRGHGKPTDRLLSILPLSHMFEQMAGLLVPLRWGANVTYPMSRQPTILFRTIMERRVTMLLLVPQVLDLFMKGIEREVKRQGRERAWDLLHRIAQYTPFRIRRLLFRQVHKKMGGALESVFAGAAPMDPELGAKWERLGVRIIQGYGATEASPVITVHPANRPRYDSPGPPLPGVDMKISEDGEVLIRGPNVTSGYWEAPEQTAATFENGWYKTGDQGFIDEDGFLHLRGRKKDMIVLASGQNVFPEDIEAVLNKHPKVRDAAVVGLPKGADVEVHAALLVDDSDAAGSAVSWANERLDEHQRVRGHTVWHEEDFPRTHTLKVKKPVIVDVLDGCCLEVRRRTFGFGGRTTSGPADIRQLVAEVAEMPLAQLAMDMRLGEELDLDSLRRVELLSAIEAELGVYLDESQVGPETTVGELAKLVEAGARDAVPVKFPRWGMSPWCRLLRGALHRTVIFPILRLGYRVRVVGEENLSGLKAPVIFAANHHLYLDNGVLIRSMPAPWRRRPCHRRRRGAVAQPGLGRDQSPSGQRIPVLQGRGRAAEPRQSGPYP